MLFWQSKTLYLAIVSDFSADERSFAIAANPVCLLGLPLSFSNMSICNFSYLPLWFSGHDFVLIVPVPVHYFLSTFEPRREKTNVLVSDLVRHKPGCAATEDG